MYSKRMGPLGSFTRLIRDLIDAKAGKQSKFGGVERYWEERYSTGGNSGAGSYKKLAEFKAAVVNAFVDEHSIRTVIDFGCGDGNQLGLANYPKYLGFDVSSSAVARCGALYKDDESKEFKPLYEYAGEQADLAISLDVVYHLVEKQVFVEYLNRLFQAARRYVIVYSTDIDCDPKPASPHVRHRCFSQWVKKHISGWELLRHIPNRYPEEFARHGDCVADFFIYRRLDDESGVGSAVRRQVFCSSLLK